MMVQAARGGGGVTFDLFGAYDHAWQIGTLIGFLAGVVQIVAGGPSRRHDAKVATAPIRA